VSGLVVPRPVALYVTERRLFKIQEKTQFKNEIANKIVFFTITELRRTACANFIGHFFVYFFSLKEL
jgi:hypothetical protein